MQLFEFKVTLANGTIPIPEKIKNKIKNNKVKVIILSDENINAGKILADMEIINKKYHNVSAFKGINPVSWQRTLRNEWK